MNRILIVTLNSVYAAVKNGPDSYYVTGRATFSTDGYLPTDRLYTGEVKGPIVPGRVMVFIDPFIGPITTSYVEQVITL